MKRSLTVVLAGLVVAALSVTPALAHEGNGNHHRQTRVNFTGIVTQINTSPRTLKFTMLQGNRPARTWSLAHPGDITVTLTNNTKFTGPYQLVDQASDLRVGDGVSVLALRSTDQLSLVALRVSLKLQRYSGTVVSFGSRISVRWSDVNKIAKAWLGAHGNPNPVLANITASTKVHRAAGGNPQPGDHVEMSARTTAGSPGTLDAVVVSVGDDDDDD